MPAVREDRVANSDESSDFGRRGETAKYLRECKIVLRRHSRRESLEVAGNGNRR